MHEKYTKKISTFIKIALTLTVLYFIGQNIYANFDKIKDYDFQINYKYFFLSIITMTISMIFPVYGWKFLLSSLNANISFVKAMKIWFISNAGRYLPGKVWQIAGIVYLGSKENIEKKTLLQSIIYSQVVANFQGIIFAVILFGGKINIPIWVIIPILLSSILIMIPKILNYILNTTILKIMKKTPLTTSISVKNMSIYFILQLINWFLMGFAFYIFINAFQIVSLFQNAQIIIFLPACWTIGLLALFAPGGIGVREGILTTLLSTITANPLGIIIPWVYRIIITIFEAVFALSFYVFGFKSKKNKKY